MSGGPQRYDASTMVTNPHLVPVFEDQPAPAGWDDDVEDDE